MVRQVAVKRLSLMSSALLESLLSSSPTRHTTGIKSPRCADRLPSHIPKIAESTVSGGGPEGTVDGTIFEMWLGSLVGPRSQVLWLNRAEARKPTPTSP